MPQQQVSTTVDHQRVAVERLMDRRGISWAYDASVPITGFDVPAGLDNQARIGPALDTETVTRYMCGMEAGDSFPAIVAVKGKSGLIVVDGNHRLMAYIRMKRTSVPTYIIDGSATAVTALMAELNALNGLPMSEAELIEHALHLVDRGFSVRDAAEQCKVPHHKVSSARTLHEARRRAFEVGLSERDWATFNRGQADRLAKVTTDEGFAAMCRLARDARLPSDVIAKIVGEVNRTRSAAKQVEIVNVHREAFRDAIQNAGEAGKPGKRLRGPFVRVRLAIGQVNAIQPTSLPFGDLKPAERDEAARQVESAIERLTEIREALV